MGRKVTRTRNLLTMTEAAYWGKVRSALRRAFAYWKPGQQAMEEAKRPYVGSNARRKYSWVCALCGGEFSRKYVECDHINPVGALNCEEDLAGFLRRLTEEDPGCYQCVCKRCHRGKTAKDKKRGK